MEKDNEETTSEGIFPSIRRAEKEAYKRINSSYTLKDFEEFLTMLSDRAEERRYDLKTVSGEYLANCTDEEFIIIVNDSRYQCLTGVKNMEIITRRIKDIYPESDK